MNKAVVNNAVRFIVSLVLQVFIFKYISLSWGDFDYIHFVIYPIFILLLPLNTPKVFAIFLAFLLGFSVDVFYDSLGVHASAAVLIAYIRPLILRILEPHQGYNIVISPSKFNLGFNWFFTYAAILLFVYLFVYFSVEAFSFVYIFDILLRTIFSFIFSFLVILLHQLIFKTRI